MPESNTLTMSFTELGLSMKVLSSIEEAGYETPTEIQKSAIPPALAGRDVLGLAQTGTGKTAAFALPILTRLEKGRARARMPRSLILEPTRELAAQVAEAIDVYGKKHKLTVVLLIGGVSFGDQERKLDRGADIVIATPGRLLDHFERGKLMLSAIEMLVVDEADRMLDMGFIPDIERIFKLTPFTRQTLFFSATMPEEINRITSTFLHNPVTVQASRPSSTASTIVQRLISVPAKPGDKRAAFRELLKGQNVSNAIVFCNRKRDIGVLERSMKKHGFNATCLHGDMDQSARMAALAAFRDGGVTYLVASDVAARGLDIPTVSHVFNFDVPSHAEDYVHRIGRTGRAGREGHAFSLVMPSDGKYIVAIERLIGQKIEQAKAGDAPGSATAVSEEAPDRQRSRRPRRTEDQAAKPQEKAQDGPRTSRPGRNDKPQEQSQDRPRTSRPGRGEKPQEQSQDKPRTSRPGRSEKPQEQSQDKPRSSRPDRDEKPQEQAASPAPGRRAPAKSKPGRERSRDNGRGNGNGRVKGLGDHVPAFMLRPVKTS